MGATTKTVNTTPNEIQPLRQGMASWLMGQGQKPAQVAGQGQFSGTAMPGQIPQTNQQQMPTQGFTGGAGVGYGAPQSRPMNPNLQAPPQTGGFNVQDAGGGAFTPSLQSPVQGGGQMPREGGGYGYWRQQQNAQSQGGPSSQPAFDPSGMQNIYAQSAQTPGRVQVGLTPDVGPIQQINPQQIGQVPQINPQQVNGPQIDPNAIPQIGGVGNIPQVGAGNIDINQILSLLGPMGGRGQIRDVNGPGVGSQSTQSVDQLGGANSQFFQNMMGQLSPAFDQRRAEALAAAKESSGNLTGSGYANMLGGAVNRSLGEEQAQLANYASQGMQTEVGRQLQLAGINNQAATSTAANNLQGQMANQGADVNFMNALLGRGGQAAGLAGQLSQANQGTQLSGSSMNASNFLQGAGLNQQGAMANQGAWLQSMLANQGVGMQGQLANQGAGLTAQQANAGNWLNAQQSNQNVDFNAQAQNQSTDFNRQMGNRSLNQSVYGQQAGMDQDRNTNLFNQGNQMNASNANAFLQMLLGMGTTGVQPNSIVPTGWGQFLQGAGQVGGQVLGKKFGG